MKSSGGESWDELPRMMDGGSVMHRGAEWKHSFDSDEWSDAGAFQGVLGTGTVAL